MLDLFKSISFTFINGSNVFSHFVKPELSKLSWNDICAISISSSSRKSGKYLTA